ncbi:NACHT domain-containing protein [Acrocarpospora catenulata]|uniref:NACHT domain-containing protein n=1 Tax=Acrocarpospora catenulata TaxID=2836182 RepID=UPI001BD9E7BF|nr:NACHT domain-containing protein [Acrocarpospora catenulata]
MPIAVNAGTGGELPDLLKPVEPYLWQLVGGSVLVFVAPAVVNEIREHRRRIRPRLLGARITESDRSRAIAIISGYVRERLDQSLGHLARVQLELSTASGLVNPPRSYYVTQDAITWQPAPDATVAEIYDELDESVLILGAPGAGKTTMLLELAEALLTKAADPAQPIPVLIELATWSQSGKRQGFLRLGPRAAPEAIHDWLLAQIDRTYGIGTAVGATWLAEDKLVLLLDGFDEVNPDLRRQCARLINELQRKHPRLRLVVGSRFAEYEDLPGDLRLQLRGAVEIRPLTRDGVLDYLAQAGHGLTGLRTAVTEDPELLELITAPFWLHVAGVAFRDTGQRRGSDQDETVERRRLLDTFVDQLLTRKRGLGRTYPRRAVLAWLGLLARTILRGRDTVLPGRRAIPIVTWTGELSRARSRALLTWAVPIGALLMVAGATLSAGRHVDAYAVANLVLWPMIPLVAFLYIAGRDVGSAGLCRRDRIVVLAWGIAMGSICCLAVLLVRAPLAEGLPGLAPYLVLALPWVLMAALIARIYSGDAVVLALVAGMAIFVTGLVWFFGPYSTRDVTVVTGSALIAVVVTMVLVGLLMVLLEQTAESELDLDPQAPRLVWLWVAVSAGLTLTGCLLVTALDRLPAVFDVRAVVLALAGTFHGFLLGFTAVLVVTTWWLNRWLMASFRQLPWRLTAFLEYAADQGLLQRVGRDYRFPHLIITQYFATFTDSDPQSDAATRP